MESGGVSGGPRRAVFRMGGGSTPYLPWAPPENQVRALPPPRSCLEGQKRDRLCWQEPAQPTPTLKPRSRLFRVKVCPEAEGLVA